MGKRIILVTGAAGFIGSNLVDALVKKGEKVRCFVRKQDNLEFLPKDKVEFIFGDLADKKSIVPAVKGVSVIYHLGAKTDFIGDWEDYRKANVLGTSNMVDLAIKEKVDRFVFFSTIRTIGLKDSKKPVNEKALYNPLNNYDKSKVEGEIILKEAFKKHKLPITIIRPSSVYGPRDRGTYFSFFKTIAAGKFFLIGKGNNLVSFVYVGNVINAVITVLNYKRTIGQTYFISDLKPYTMKKIAATIYRSFGKKLPSFYLPVSLGYIIGMLMLAFSRIIKFKPILSPERIKNLTISYVFDLTKAKTDFKYAPKITLERGVEITTAWYKKNGWIK